MAYRHIDPTPFIPPGFEHTVIPGRATMVRAIGGRPQQRNEDMAIVSIDPMPLHQVQFANIREVLDYWTKYHIQAAIASFGKLEVWEEDLAHLSRVMIKAKVVNLTSIPKWIVISEGDNFEGDTWTVQCEVIQRKLLGQQAQDEDPVPVHNPDVDLLEFDFFGYGQMEPGHVFGMPIPEEFVNGPPAEDWGMWSDAGPPDAAPAAELNPLGLDLNALPDGNLNMEEVDDEEEVDEEIIVEEPDIPAQMNEPAHQVSMTISNITSDGSDSSVNQPPPAKQLPIMVLAIPANQNNPEQVLPDLNVAVDPNADMQDVHADDPVQQVLQQHQEGGQIVPDLNIAQDGEMQIDHQPIMPNMNLEEMIGEEVNAGGMNMQDPGIGALQAQMQGNNHIIPGVNQDMQIGFVQIEDGNIADPVFETFYNEHVAKKSFNADNIRMWAKFFSPNGSTDSVTHIPTEWMMFFSLRERVEKKLPHPIQNETANKSLARSPSRVKQPNQDKSGWRKEPIQKSKKTMMSSQASTHLLPSAAAASLLPRRVSQQLCFAGAGAVASRRRGSRLAVVRGASAEAPAYTSDSLILYFKAEGTMEERATPKITESLQSMEGVKDLEVLIEEGIASVV
ncbi:hypothetical protein EJB05_34988, partial [Eragrostis curvula]